MADAATIAGQRRRIAHSIDTIRHALPAMELANETDANVECAQNIAYMAVRLVSETARLYQMLREPHG